MGGQGKARRHREWQWQLGAAGSACGSSSSFKHWPRMVPLQQGGEWQQAAALLSHPVEQHLASQLQPNRFTHVIRLYSKFKLRMASGHPRTHHSTCYQQPNRLSSLLNTHVIRLYSRFKLRMASGMGGSPPLRPLFCSCSACSWAKLLMSGMVPVRRCSEDEGSGRVGEASRCCAATGLGVAPGCSCLEWCRSGAASAGNGHCLVGKKRKIVAAPAKHCAVQRTAPQPLLQHSTTQRLPTMASCLPYGSIASNVRLLYCATKYNRNPPCCARK